MCPKHPSYRAEEIGRHGKRDECGEILILVKKD